MSSHRSFTITHVETASGHVKGASNLGGRFVSRTASGAARKAASQICRDSKIRGRCVLVICMRETTRGSKGKSYTYNVRRIHDPRTVERDGKEITFNYRTEVEAVKKHSSHKSASKSAKKSSKKSSKKSHSKKSHSKKSHSKKSSKKSKRSSRKSH